MSQRSLTARRLFHTENEVGSNPAAGIKKRGNMHEEKLFQFFGYSHLPQHLKDISKLFHDLAEQMIETLPVNAERTMALRKLLEAKDCAVRACLFK